jgi:hypothetical protein
VKTFLGMVVNRRSQKLEIPSGAAWSTTSLDVLAAAVANDLREGLGTPPFIKPVERAKVDPLIGLLGALVFIVASRLSASPTVETAICGAPAIAALVSRCRRNCSIRATWAGRNRCGQRRGAELRSPSSRSPARHRFNHRCAVRSDTPAAAAARPTGKPASIRSTIRTRPRGVRRAFLWTFIRDLRQELELRNPNLSPTSRVNNLHSNDI